MELTAAAPGDRELPLQVSTSVVFIAVGTATGAVLAAMMLHLLYRALTRSRELLQIELDLAVEAAFRSHTVSDDLVHRLRQLPHRIARRSIVHALNVLGQAYLSEISEVYERLGFAQRPLRELRSWSSTRRAEAALELGAFRRAEATAACTGMLRDRNAEVRLAAARALSDLRAPGAIRAVLESIPSCTRWAVGDAAALIRGWGLSAVPELMETLRESGVRQARLGAVEVLGDLHCAPARPVLEELLGSDDAELRVCTVRALGKIGGDGIPAVLEGCLRDKSWEVRAVAARMLRSYGTVATGPLQRALNDPSWWVRLNAGESLAAIEGAGLESLRETLSSTDLFARDMARQMLERLQVRETPA